MVYNFNSMNNKNYKKMNRGTTIQKYKKMILQTVKTNTLINSQEKFHSNKLIVVKIVL